MLYYKGKIDVYYQTCYQEINLRLFLRSINILTSIPIKGKYEQKICILYDY